MKIRQSKEFWSVGAGWGSGEVSHLMRDLRRVGRQTVKVGGGGEIIFWAKVLRWVCAWWVGGIA